MDFFSQFFNQLFGSFNQNAATAQPPDPVNAAVVVADSPYADEWFSKGFGNQTPEWAPWHPNFEWTPVVEREANWLKRTSYAAPAQTPPPRREGVSPQGFSGTPERASQRLPEVPGIEVSESPPPYGAAGEPTDRPALSPSDAPGLTQEQVDQGIVVPPPPINDTAARRPAPTLRPPMRLGAAPANTSFTGAVRDAAGPRIRSRFEMDPDTRRAAAQQIIDFEARRGRDGSIRVYGLPSNDGGGSYEVAGINQRYHPKAAKELATLIRQGKTAEAEAYAVEYVAKYTDKSAAPFANPGVNFSVRDITFNRGPGGANGIIRMALGANPRSKGDAHKALSAQELARAVELSEKNPAQFVQSLTKAREAYEYRFVGKRPNLDQGLRNRWRNVEKVALTRAVQAPVVAEADPTWDRSPFLDLIDK